MNIRFLETAICLARLRNFRATADALNITPAAVSNRIAAMEIELGVRLFDRDSRDVQLTADGLAFIQGAREVVDRYNVLVDDLKPRDTIGGPLRIGLLPSMAQTILPGIVMVLREQFPMVRLSIVTDTSTSILHKLRQREIDVAICIPSTNTAGLHVVELFQLGMFWVVSPLILRHDPGETLQIEDLLAYPIISYEAGTHNHGRMVDFFADLLSEDSIVHYSNSLGTTIGMITSGIGISVLPPVCLQRELREGSLAVLRVNPVFPPTRYAIIGSDQDDRKIVRLASEVARGVAAGFCRQYDASLVAMSDAEMSAHR